MLDPFNRPKKRRKRLRALEVDSWIDATLWNAGHSLGRFYERATIFLRRFSFTGFKRFTSELASEGMTLGVAGALLALALAVPAFQDVRKDWRTQSDYSVTFYDRYGTEIGQRGIFQETAFELEELPEHVLQAVLATEDRRFFDHFGIDVMGTFRALVENAKAGGIVQGGSSISQQLAKNLFLTNERTLQRKIREAYLALWLEANLTKREILKLYLDRAYMGGGAFGVGAASQFYFDKPVSELVLAESALLAGLFKAPARYAPHINLPAARARANEVLTNMVQAGFMTEGQVIGARLNPAKVVARSRSTAPDYYLDWAFEQVKQNVPGKNRVLFARTTIDMRLQAAAEAAVESSLRESGDAYRVRQAALVSMEHDGAVRALVGGRDYGTSTFNRATNALRQPGSSFKVYVYATALENGYTPASIVPDAPVSIGNWSPQNYNRRYAGRVTLKRALTKSYNTVPVRLSIRTGRQPIADMAKAMGIKSPVRVTRSLPLGVSEVTPMDMASGYTTIANGGYRVEPHALLSVTNNEGEVLYDRFRDLPAPVRVLTEETSVGMVDMLNNVVLAGTGRRAQLPGINAAGKTGTTQAYRDAWFVGFTGNYSTSVWFGNDNFQATRRLTGGRLPAETWQKYMRIAHINADLKPLPGLPLQDGSGTEELLAAAADGSDQVQLTSESRLTKETGSMLQRLEDRFRAGTQSNTLQQEAAAQPASEAGRTLTQ